MRLFLQGVSGQLPQTLLLFNNIKNNSSSVNNNNNSNNSNNSNNNTTLSNITANDYYKSMSMSNNNNNNSDNNIFYTNNNCFNNINTNSNNDLLLLNTFTNSNNDIGFFNSDTNSNSNSNSNSNNITPVDQVVRHPLLAAGRLKLRKNAMASQRSVTDNNFLQCLLLKSSPSFLPTVWMLQPFRLVEQVGRLPLLVAGRLKLRQNAPPSLRRVTDNIFLQSLRLKISPVFLPVARVLQPFRPVEQVVGYPLLAARRLKLQGITIRPSQGKTPEQNFPQSLLVTTIPNWRPVLMSQPWRPAEHVVLQPLLALRGLKRRGAAFRSSLRNVPGQNFFHSLRSKSALDFLPANLHKSSA
jgi:hypothetical protein